MIQPKEKEITNSIKQEVRNKFVIFHKRFKQENIEEQIKKLKNEIAMADAILIGAGSGLSTAAGHTYTGERFEKYFSDFIQEFGVRDMYSGGAYPFPDKETYWGWVARLVYVNRYMPASNDTYERLLEVVKDKDYFVITTNVDHCFQQAGFDKKRLWYVQGDYGLFQCRDACHSDTYDNYDAIVKMLLSADFLEKKDGKFVITPPERWSMRVDLSCIPNCPHCGKPMTENLRIDDKFVQDEGWYAARDCYEEFRSHNKNRHILYMELGVGMNTPVWIKYPFWRMTEENPKATYACLNFGEAYAPSEIASQSICVDGDITEILKRLK